MKRHPLFTKLVLCLCLAVSFDQLRAQDIRDTRMVGMLAFSTNSYIDSIAARNIYAAVTRILVQTIRFTILEIDKWNLTQDEIERQRGAGFLERDIIQQGKSLGAQVLIAGFVKNAELYQYNGKFSARVDYELKYIDVETGKSIAAASFTGDSENLNTKAHKLSNSLSKAAMPLFFAANKNWKTVMLSSAALEVMSEQEKNAIKGKTIDAIEESIDQVNTWVHKTFNFNLLLLQTMEEDKKKGFQSVLVEGGEDIGMKTGYKLKIVLVTEMETSKGKIRDEEPVAELEIEEVRAQTSKCKVVKGGTRIQEISQNKNMRIVFN